AQKAVFALVNHLPDRHDRISHAEFSLRNAKLVYQPDKAQVKRGILRRRSRIKECNCIKNIVFARANVLTNSAQE
ncbi:MAG: hypothetical protein K2M90_02765, partial [Treponemataceae bacterium]|nr:hypothetical protein [Treponemataceae bacterium]